MHLKDSNFNMRLVGCLALFLFTSTVFAQEGNCDHKPVKKVRKKYEEASAMYATNKGESVKLLKEINTLDPEMPEPYYFLAKHYFEAAFPERDKVRVAQNFDAKQKEDFVNRAKAYFEDLNRVCPAFSGHLGCYYLGVIYHMEGNYAAAAPMFKAYLDDEFNTTDNNEKVAKRLYKECLAIDKILKNPVPYTPAPLKGTNTYDNEYLPMLSPDNEQLYFTRQMVASIDPMRPKGPGNDRKEYFSLASKLSVDSFSNGYPLPFPFNDFSGTLDGGEILGNGGACLTPDNKRMYLTVNIFQQFGNNSKVKNTSIYFTDLKEGMWTQLRPLRVANDLGGNPTWEGQPTISSDGNMIIFASARETSMFSMDAEDKPVYGMDLFMITKMKDGSWTAPKNLGDVINTKGNEKTPFLHTDSKTLYFSSNAHPGLGGYDLFYTRMDDYGNWMTPVNLGTPINTKYDDYGLIVSLDGKSGFLTSGTIDAKDGLAQQIITFPLYEQARPEKVVMMKGTLKDDKGNPLKDGKVEIKNAKTGEITEATVDKNTGQYVAVMTIPDPQRVIDENRKVILKLGEKEVEAPFGSHVENVNGKQQILAPGEKLDSIKGKHVVIPVNHKKVTENGEEKIVAKTSDELNAPDGQYVITAKADKKAFSSKVVELNAKDIDGSKTIRGSTASITVEALEVKKPIRLNDIVFANDSYELTRQSKLVLDELYQFLIDNAKIDIAIHGHTDNVGDDAKNLELSKNRAKACMEYLASKGIAVKRLSSQGFGETKPKTVNTTEEGRAANRRVEFVVLKM